MEKYSGDMIYQSTGLWIQHGHGKQVYPTNHEFEFYIGNWNVGKFDGEGIIKYSNGEGYEGEFVHG